MNKLYGVGGRLNLSNPIFEVLCTKLYHCVFWMVSYAFSSQMTKYAVSKSVGSSPTSNQRENDASHDYLFTNEYEVEQFGRPYSVKNYHCFKIKF